jgi:hypothetical protein
MPQSIAALTLNLRKCRVMGRSDAARGNVHPRAQAGRYALVPEPDVRQNSSNRVASAYVSDKKANQFWICTARYNFQDLTANNGDCVKLQADIGRPSLTEAYDLRAVTDVFWFIEPTGGEVQFCAVRHAELCVRMNLP